MQYLGSLFLSYNIDTTYDIILDDWPLNTWHPYTVPRDS